MEGVRGESEDPPKKIAPIGAERTARATAACRERAEARRASAVDLGDGPLTVLRVMLSSRYPRAAPAIAASAGISRAAGYRALLRIESCSGVPLLRQPHVERGHRVILWGVDWEKLRAMG